MEPRKLILFMLIQWFSIQKFQSFVHANEIESLETTSLNRTELVYNHYRLPTSVRPENYNLKIITYLGDRFEGEVLIKLQILEDTKNITLHSNNLIIDEPRINIERVPGSKNVTGAEENTCIKTIARNDRYNYLIIHLCNIAKKGEEYLLAIPFNGTLGNGHKGYFMDSYEVDGEERWLSVTQFEPIGARKAFPCFDEPALKAKFTITLGHHRNYTSLSNMPLKEIRPMSDRADWVWSEFEESVPMSTYLVAYTVNDFSYMDSKTTLNDGVQFRAWARPDVISQCEYGSIIGPKVLKFFENTFQLKFPLPKIDQFVVPSFSSAMENWGLVNYKEAWFLYDEKNSGNGRKREVAKTVAHELAHQWFGNIVTMEWWDNVWLNEGFATFISMWGTNHLHPEWSKPVPDPLESIEKVFRDDASKDSEPLSPKVQEIAEINYAINDAIYQKGFIVLRMMHYFLGHETFLGGINLYLKNHLYQNVRQDDLWKALNEVSHANGALSDKYDIKTIMDTWTLQAGYPLIKVKRDYEKGTVTVTQTRYLARQRDMYRSAESNCWWVPLTYTTKSEHDFNRTTTRAWLECDANNVPIVKELNDIPADEWVCFNIKKAGLYKVQYDEQNWNMIIDTLSSDNYRSIGVVNRAHLIYNAMTLAWDGHQDYDLALRLIPYLKREREYFPWKTVLDELSKIKSMLENSSDNKQIEDLMIIILEPIYTYLYELDAKKPINSSVVSTTTTDLKDLIFDSACGLNMTDCRKRSMVYVKKWRNETEPDTNNPIPKDLRRHVYCTAMRYGDDNEYDFLKERLSNTNSDEEKQRIFRALGCPQDTELLKRSLNWTNHGDNRKNQKYFKSFFKSIAQNEVGAHLLRDFLKKNLQTLYELYSTDARGFADLLQSIASHINNRIDYEDLKEFLEINEKYFAKIKVNVRQVLEIAEGQIYWKEHSYEKFVRLLNRSLLTIEAHK